VITALSQVSSLPSGFAKDLEDYSAAGCQAVEVWLTKLESYLETHSLQSLRDLLHRHEIKLPVASLQGGLLSSQGEARRAAWDLFGRGWPCAANLRSARSSSRSMCRYRRRNIR
jgi:hypothetical protein